MTTGHGQFKAARLPLTNATLRLLLPLLALFCLVLGSASAFAQTNQAPQDAPRPRQPSRPWAEFSLMGSISRSNYGNGSYSRSQRVSGSVGFYLTSTTELEVTYTDSRSLYNSEPAPKTITVTRDRTLGCTLSQHLLPRSSFLQPYIKGGAAQLNRRQSVVYNGAQQPETTLKQPSAVLGAGLRLNVLSFLSLKVEFTTYLINFQMREARQNYEWDAGVSFVF
jgi:hypothetical protein